MKRITIRSWLKPAALGVAVLLMPVLSAFAIETDLLGPLFSSTFFTELDAANRASDPVPQLEVLYEKFKRPSEQAEVELTIARIFCQRTGFVNPAESIRWYDKALVCDLPATALAKQFILRGNMHERLKHRQEAVADYIRGLLACLQFNLPDSWPNQDGGGKLQPPPTNSVVGFNGEQTADQRFAQRQQAADYRRESDMIRREHDLLQQRYYYIDAIKRVQKDEKLSEAAIREMAEKLTNRKDRIEELLRRVREPNPRPWP